MIDLAEISALQNFRIVLIWGSREWQLSAPKRTLVLHLHSVSVATGRAISRRSPNTPTHTLPRYVRSE